MAQFIDTENRSAIKETVEDRKSISTCPKMQQLILSYGFSLPSQIDAKTEDREKQRDFHLASTIEDLLSIYINWVQCC